MTVRSDIYALGLVLYQLFTGKRAFAADSAAEISKLQQTGPASPTSHVSLRCLLAAGVAFILAAFRVSLGGRALFNDER